MHVESTRGKQSERPRMARFAKLVKFVRRVELGQVDKNTAVDVYCWLREVCSTKLRQSNIILGGAGVVVQADESLFRHKTKGTKRYYIK